MKVNKKASYGLIGSFTVKKVEFYLRAVFPKLFIIFQVTEGLITCHIKIPLKANFI